MAHACEVEEKEKQETLIAEWKRQNGICAEHHDDTDKSWNDIIKQMLSRPYAYIFLSIAFFSPYASQILDKIFQFWGK